MAKGEQTTGISFLDELALQSLGRPLNAKEQAILTGPSDETFEQHLAALRMIGDLPKGYGVKAVPPRPLCQNEDNFFIGAIALGNVTVERVDWGGNQVRHNYSTVVSTESRRPSRRTMLRDTIGLWAEGPGQTRESTKRLRFYLPHEKFRHLIRRDQNVTDSILDQINHFGPMVLGLITNGLRGEENRIPYPNYNILGKIYESWRGHFGFDMGGFQYRTYPDSDTVSGVIIIRDWELVMGTLMNIETVGSRKKGLKFLPALQKGYQPGG